MNRFSKILFLILFSVLINCGVVDKLSNKNPVILSVTAVPSRIGTHDTTTVKVEAEDPDDDLMSYKWTGSQGQFISTTGEETQWIAPDESGRFQLKVEVKDENGGKTSGEVYVDVVGDESPIVLITQPVENEIISGLGKYKISADVQYTWSIDRVDFFVDGDSLLCSDRTRPYEFIDWDVTSLAGPKLIHAKAYDATNLSNFGIDSVHVTIEGIIPIPE